MPNTSRVDAADAARDTTRASGSRPTRSAPTAEPSSIALAPSFSGEELPAVTVPSVRKTGLSRASFSSDESARIDSSRSRSVPGTGTTSVVVRPGVPGRVGELVAAGGELVLRLAADPVLVGEDLGALAQARRSTAAGISGLTIRQPSVVECSVSWPRG